MCKKHALVNFHGTQIPTVKVGDKIFVAMKPVVENMGLVWHRQSQKIQDSTRYQHKVIPLNTPGGTQKMICIPIEKLNGWLFGVSAEKVHPELKEKVLCYQDECFRVLHDHWSGKNEQVINLLDPAEAADAWAEQYRKSTRLSGAADALAYADFK